MFFMLFFQFFDAFIITDESAEKIMNDAQRNLGMGHLLIVTVFVFLSVIADDRKSSIFEANIAIGLSRTKLLLAKTSEFALVMTLFYFLMTSFRLLWYKLCSVPLSNRQLGLIAIYAAFAVAHGIICLMAATLADIALDSTAAGIITLVIMLILLSLVLKTVETIYKINLYNYIPGGLLDAAYANAAVGIFPWQLIPTALYGIAAFAATSALFNKKELQL